MTSRLWIVSAAVFAFVASSAFFAPVARAEPFNCYCGSKCTFSETVDAADIGKATTACVASCEKKAVDEDSKDMCNVSKPAADTQPNKPPSGPVKLINPLGVSSVPQLVGNILKAAIGVVGALSLLIFIYGGFIWLTSAGDAGKVQAGKDAMKWAAIGLAVIFTSYTLVQFVFSSLTG